MELTSFSYQRSDDSKRIFLGHRWDWNQTCKIQALKKPLASEEKVGCCFQITSGDVECLQTGERGRCAVTTWLCFASFCYQLTFHALFASESVCIRTEHQWDSADGDITCQRCQLSRGGDRRALHGRHMHLWGKQNGLTLIWLKAGGEQRQREFGAQSVAVGNHQSIF